MWIPGRVGCVRSQACRVHPPICKSFESYRHCISANLSNFDSGRADCLFPWAVGRGRVHGNEDPSSLKKEFGAANRGVSGTVRDGDDLSMWPKYVQNVLYVTADVYPFTLRAADQLIHLYGGTCADDVGLTMTLGHELQHAIQHDKDRKLWAVNSLIRTLAKAVNELKLEWPDIPIELDARIVAKRVALDLHDQELINRYIDKKIAEAVEPHDIFDWRFVRKLEPSTSIDLLAETHRLLHRLKNHRREFEEALWENRDSPDFSDIDLDEFFASSLQGQ